VKILCDVGRAFKLWLRLASTDKVAFTKLLLVSGLSPGFLSAFDEPTLNGIIENFIASTDWRPIERTIRVDLSMDVREHTARIKSPTLLITAKHDQIVPPAYSENLVPDAKTIELNSGHLIFLERPVELASAILSFCQLQAGWSLEITSRRVRDHSEKPDKAVPAVFCNADGNGRLVDVHPDE
jgi:pimeloyl-ACP methyl ester carboxylesterase